MTDRTVIVRLLAEVGQYQAAMGMAGRTATELSGRARAAAVSTAASMAGVNRSVRTSAMGVSRSLGSIRGMITGFGVPIVGAVLVKSFLDFEQQMARVKAVGDPFGQTEIGMRRMRTAALEMGQQYGFTAVEVGKAQEELAKGGIHTQQILGGVLNSALTLAAAGDISLANAAKYLAVVMTQFNLTAADTPHIADRLSQAANATVSGVDEMATSLSYVGPQAHAMGMSLDETVTTISLFNKAGLDADMAGTNLRGLLVSLTSPSHLAAMELAKLGITLYDSKGHFAGVANMAQELQDHLGSLTDKDRDFTLGRIASNHQLQGALILYRAGTKGIAAMQTVIDAQASAEQVAAEKTESFTGEVKKLGAAIQSDFIGMMHKAIPAMGPVVGTVKSGAEWFGELGGAAQLAAVALGVQLLMARRVSTGMGGFSQNMRLAASTSRDYAIAQAELNRMQQSSAARVSPAYAGQVRALGTMVTGLRDASSEVRGYAGVWGSAAGRFQAAQTGMERLGAVSRGVMGTMRLGITGLTSALGGPWMIAIMAATVAWGAMKQEEAKQKQAHDDLVDSLDSLGQSYATTGKIAESDLSSLAKRNDLLKDLVTNSTKYGVTINDVAKAASGDLKVQEEVLRNLDARKRALQDQLKLSQQANFGGGELDFSGIGMGAPIPGSYGSMASDDTKRRRANEQAIRSQLDAIKKLYPALKEEFDQNRALAKAYKDLSDLHLSEFMADLGLKAGEASPYLRELSDNASILASSEVKAADKAKALQDSLGLLQGQLTGTSDAMASFRDSSTRDTFFAKVEGKAATKGAKGRMVNDYVDQYKTVATKAHWERTPTGAKDAKGHNVFEEEFVPAGTKRVKIARKKIGSHREGATKGEAAIEDTYTPLYDPKMIDTVTGKFNTLVKVQGKYNDQLTQTSVKFDQFMSSRAQKALGVVSAAYTEATRGGADAGQAAQVAALRYGQLKDELIDSLEPITGNRKEAEKLATAYLGIPKDIETVFGQFGIQASIDKGNELGLTIQAVPGKKEVDVVAETEAARVKLGALGYKVETLPDGRFLVRFANYDDATKAVNTLVAPREVKVTPKVMESSLDSSINAIEKRMELAMEAKGSVKVSGNKVDVTGGSVNVYGTGGKATKNRWGGVYGAMGGSLRQAVTATPGRPLYQWAEEGTGGEAFIPRFGRRDQALSILRKASAWYGQQIVPEGRFPSAPGTALAVASAPVTRSASAGGGTTQVRVFLGNEELTDRMRVVVENHSSQSALQSAWGRRA